MKLFESSINVFGVVTLLVLSFGFSTAYAGEDLTEASDAATAEITTEELLAMKPADVVDSIPKGQIKSPYEPTDAKVAEEGHTAYMETSCNGCHGGTGGGGMGPPLSNSRWVYGNDVDTLFRLVTLGTIELQTRGYTRLAMENVAFPMPGHGYGETAIESLTTDRLLKIINWVQSLHVKK